MGFVDNDFLLIEYSIRVKETGNLIDTSDEELAKRENIYDSEKIYGPGLIVIGRKWINEIVEEEIRKSNVGSEIVVEIPPEKAFGTRDPGKVRVYRLSDFKRRGIDVRVGEVVEINGVQGIVKNISGGRVVVDFNHPLAGKTLVYRVKIVAKIDDLVDKVKALATRYLGVKSNELEIKYSSEDRSVSITIPVKYMSKRNIQYGKISLATDILEFLKDSVDKVVFTEIIARKRESGESVEKTSGESQSN
ncbi:MAG: FKBP-type peptidyl-prolyl cis-trans isomerase [Desulfurococcaceae archaeon]